MKRSGAQHVAQSRLSQQTGGVVRVSDVRHGYRGVGHAVVDDSIHRHCHAVFGQHLTITKKKYVIHSSFLFYH